ncbi:MAG: hypothetical protein JO161_08095 [Planctomycetaceae bacterium]|nr:hypothetical protein [Planctomycetaceae bacterium]
MSQIAIEQVEEGLHPSEVVVTIRTADGKTEEVAVDRRLVTDQRLRASAVGEESNRVLVELPRETLSGSWRVWVPKTAVFAQEEAAA